MPCENCDCCRCQEDDDYEDYDTSNYVPPPPPPPARPAPGPEVWMNGITAIFQKYGTQVAINLPALSSLVLQSIGCEANDWNAWGNNLMNYIRESPSFTITKGKGGGVRLAEATRIALEIKKKPHLNDTYNGIKKAIEETLQTHRGAWVSHEVLKNNILTKCGISEWGLSTVAVIKDGLKDGWLHCNGSLAHLAYMLTTDFQARVAGQLAAVPDAAEAHVAEVMKSREEWDQPKDNYTCKCGNKKLSTLTDKSCWSCGEPVRNSHG